MGMFDFVTKPVEKAVESVKKTIEDPKRIVEKPFTFQLDTLKDGYKTGSETLAKIKTSATGVISEIQNDPTLANIVAGQFGLGGLLPKGPSEYEPVGADLNQTPSLPSQGISAPIAPSNNLLFYGVIGASLLVVLILIKKGRK